MIIEQREETIDEEMHKSLDKNKSNEIVTNVQDALDKIEEITQENVEVMHKAVEESIESLKLY